MKRTFISTLITLAALPLSASAFSSEISTSQTINQLQLNELAATYSQEKVSRLTHGKSQSQADALLIDLGVISASDLANKKVLAQKLSRYVADQQDPSENYLGNVSDKNLTERVLKAWHGTAAIQDEKTLSLLNHLIDKGYTTGYNISRTQDASHFKPEFMLRYGHNNIQHAVQLLHLMKSEGFDPKVQFIVKSSAFLYLPEWGEPTYNVTKLKSGKIVAMEKEYNIDFEFRTKARKAAFMNLINHYAKKDSEDEKGLIIESWWQPFYRSYTQMTGYETLTENRIYTGPYQADLMSLPENAKKQIQEIKATGKASRVDSLTVWVNPSFYRYMTGNFK